MKFRELLQIEIWSKRTTQKCLAWSGIVFGCLLALAAVEMFWITPGERNESRVALTRIDQLQDSASLSDEDFGARARQAVREIDAALREAWTYRDVGVTLQLSKYLHSVLLERLQLRKEREMEKSQDSRAKQSQAWRERLHSSGEQLRRELHKELD